MQKGRFACFNYWPANSHLDRLISTLTDGCNLAKTWSLFQKKSIYLHYIWSIAWFTRVFRFR